MSAADTQFDKNAKAGDSRNSAVTQNLAAGDSVTVTATRETSSFFARIFDHDHTTITVTARATIESYTSYASTGDVMPRLEDVQPNRPVGRERAVHSPTPELAATRRRPDRDQPGRRHDVAERLQPGAGGRFRLLRDHWVRQPVDPGELQELRRQVRQRHVRRAGRFRDSGLEHGRLGPHVLDGVHSSADRLTRYAARHGQSGDLTTG